MAVEPQKTIFINALWESQEKYTEWCATAENTYGLATDDWGTLAFGPDQLQDAMDAASEKSSTENAQWSIHVTGTVGGEGSYNFDDEGHDVKFTGEGTVKVTNFPYGSGKDTTTGKVVIGEGVTIMGIGAPSLHEGSSNFRLTNQTIDIDGTYTYDTSGSAYAFLRVKETTAKTELNINSTGRATFCYMSNDKGGPFTVNVIGDNADFSEDSQFVGLGEGGNFRFHQGSTLNIEKYGTAKIANLFIGGIENKRTTGTNDNLILDTGKLTLTTAATIGSNGKAEIKNNSLLTSTENIELNGGEYKLSSGSLMSVKSLNVNNWYDTATQWEADKFFVKNGDVYNPIAEADFFAGVEYYTKDNDGNYVLTQTHAAGSSAFTIDYSSTLKYTDSVTVAAADEEKVNAGAFTVNLAGLDTYAGEKKGFLIVDGSTATGTITGSIVTDGLTVGDNGMIAGTNYKYVKTDKDIYVYDTTVDTSKVYISEDVDTKSKFGEAMTVGENTYYVGINLFANASDAFAGVADGGTINGNSLNPSEKIVPVKGKTFTIAGTIQCVYVWSSDPGPMVNCNITIAEGGLLEMMGSTVGDGSAGMLNTQNSTWNVKGTLDASFNSPGHNFNQYGICQYGDSDAFDTFNVTGTMKVGYFDGGFKGELNVTGENALLEMQGNATEATTQFKINSGSSVTVNDGAKFTSTGGLFLLADSTASLTAGSTAEITMVSIDSGASLTVTNSSFTADEITIAENAAYTFNVNLGAKSKFAIGTLNDTVTINVAKDTTEGSTLKSFYIFDGIANESQLKVADDAALKDYYCIDNDTNIVFTNLENLKIVENATRHNAVADGEEALVSIAMNDGADATFFKLLSASTGDTPYTISKDETVAGKFYIKSGTETVKTIVLDSAMATDYTVKAGWNGDIFATLKKEFPANYFFNAAWTDETAYKTWVADTANAGIVAKYGLTDDMFGKQTFGQLKVAANVVGVTGTAASNVDNNYNPTQTQNLYLLSTLTGDDTAYSEVAFSNRGRNLNIINATGEASVILKDSAEGYPLFLHADTNNNAYLDTYTHIAEGVIYEGTASTPQGMLGGTIDLDGKILMHGTGNDSYVPWDALVALNISKTGAYEFCRTTNLQGIVTVTGDAEGKTYTADAQFKHTNANIPVTPDATNGGHGLNIGGAVNGKTAGYVVKDYGYVSTASSLFIANTNGSGFVELDNHGKFTVTGYNTVGYVKDDTQYAGSLSISDGSIFTVGKDMTVNATGSVTQDATSTVTVTGAITIAEGGSYTLDLSGFTAAEGEVYRLLVSAASGADTISVSGDDKLAEGWKAVRDSKSIYIYDTTKVDFSDMVVNADWTTFETGDVITINDKDYYFGLTAFTTTADAVAMATNKAVHPELTSYKLTNNGTDITLLTGENLLNVTAFEEGLTLSGAFFVTETHETISIDGNVKLDPNSTFQFSKALKIAADSSFSMDYTSTLAGENQTITVVEGGALNIDLSGLLDGKNRTSWMYSLIEGNVDSQSITYDFGKGVADQDEWEKTTGYTIKTDGGKVYLLDKNRIDTNVMVVNPQWGDKTSGSVVKTTDGKSYIFGTNAFNNLNMTNGAKTVIVYGTATPLAGSTDADVKITESLTTVNVENYLEAGSLNFASYGETNILLKSNSMLKLTADGKSVSIVDSMNVETNCVIDLAKGEQLVVLGELKMLNENSIIGEGLIKAGSVTLSGMTATTITAAQMASFYSADTKIDFGENGAYFAVKGYVSEEDRAAYRAKHGDHFVYDDYINVIEDNIATIDSKNLADVVGKSGELRGGTTANKIVLKKDENANLAGLNYNMRGGKNTITIGAGSEFKLGNLSNVTTVSLANGVAANLTKAELKDVVMSAGKTTFTAGNYSDVTVDSLTKSDLGGANTVKSGNFANLTVNGAMSNMAALTIGKSTTLNVAGSYTGTQDKNTITIGNDSTAAFADSINLFGGANQISVGSRSSMIVRGDVKNVQTIKIANGNYDNAKESVVSGSIIIGGVWTGIEGKNTLNAGNYTVVGVEAIRESELGSTFQLTVGSNSALTVNGVIESVNKLTAKNGIAYQEFVDGKKLPAKTQGITIVTVNGKITGTTAADTISFGSYNRVTAKDIDLKDGKNAISFGTRTTATVGDLSGINKLTLGNGTAANAKKGIDQVRTKVTAGAIQGTAENDTISVGKDAVLYTGNVDLTNGVAAGAKEKNTVAVGNNSILAIGLTYSETNGWQRGKEGDLTGAASITLGNGTAPATDATEFSEYAAFIGVNGDVDMTSGAAADKATIKAGNYAAIEIFGDLKFSDEAGAKSKDQVTIGKQSGFAVRGTVTGLDVLNVGMNSIVVGNEVFLNEIAKEGSEITGKRDNTSRLVSLGTATDALTFTDIVTENADNTVDKAATKVLTAGEASNGWLSLGYGTASGIDFTQGNKDTAQYFNDVADWSILKSDATKFITNFDENSVQISADSVDAKNMKITVQESSDGTTWAESTTISGGDFIDTGDGSGYWKLSGVATGTQVAVSVSIKDTSEETGTKGVYGYAITKIA